MSDVEVATSGDVTIEVRGLQTAIRQLAKVAEDTSDLSGSLREGALVVAKAARPPVLTGRLFMSIRPTATKRAGYIRAGGARVPYAGPIHWGWRRRNIAPQPFLVTALAARQPQAVQILETGVRKTIARHNLAP